MSDNARSQAEAQVQSIVSMVRAMECDFERLQELREEIDDIISEHNVSPAQAREIWRCQTDEATVAEFYELEQQAGEFEDAESVDFAIYEDPLSVEFRSGWTNPGEKLQAEEFRIVLCTGGPHVELQGELDYSGEPSRVRVLFKDWGESGEYYPSDSEREALMTYCARVATYDLN